MQNFGRYQVLGELGRGAMGVVYRALDPSIGRTVAIKTIKLTEFVESGEKTHLRDRLLREAQSAGILSHPNIVTIYDVGEENNIAYIAMEFVNGPTLEHLLNSSGTDQQLILNIIQQTAAALDYAHKRGIVHRDIKPANIMIDEGITAKIADFGVAKIQSQQMTQLGTILGTPNYMSPEQIQGLPVSGAADQFSLAVIAYELLTGEKPFSAETLTTLMFKLLKEDPEPPQRINPSLGWQIETVLKRAMAKEPTDRYANCSDFAKAFTNACNSSRGWRPLAPGSRQNLPTLVDRASLPPAVVAPVTIAAASKMPQDETVMALPKVAPKAAPKAGPSAPASAQTAEVDDTKPDPKPLRVMRTVAVVVLAAGFALAAIIAAFNYYASRTETVPTAQTNVPASPADETPTTPNPSKPSPTATPVVPSLTPATQPRVQKPDANTTPAEQRPARASAAAEVAAQMTTNPAGAMIMVDSKSELTCKAPCSLNLAPGRHTLAATLAGYRPALRIFELPRDSDLTVAMEAMTGTVMVKSEPPGGTIMIDGQTRAEKTPALIKLPAGSHKLEVLHEGYRNYVEVLEIKDSVITNIDVNWASK
jgi:serine/threonine-protein kinase